MLSSKLRPLGELILAARCGEFAPDFEVLGLHLALVGCGFRGRDGEEVVECPELVVLAMKSWLLEGAYQVVDGCGADGVDEVDDDLEDEYRDQERSHLGVCVWVGLCESMPHPGFVGSDRKAKVLVRCCRRGRAMS